MAPPPPKRVEEEESEEETTEEESSEEEDDNPRAVPTAAVSKKKWDDEEEEDDVLDSWDAADDSEEERQKEEKSKAAAEKAAAEAAANKKSKTQRIEEKKLAAAAEKEAAARELAGLAKETPAERREREKLMSIESDMMHAEDLFGAVGIGAGSGGTRSKPIAIVDPKDPGRSIDLSAMQIFKPTNKATFDQLRDVLVPLLTANVKKPHYSMFLQEFTRAITKDLSSEQIRLVASKLTTLSNEKQKEEKDAQKGGKKKKAAPKAKLANAGKEAATHDTTNYNDAGYDDMDDFM
ncbi:eukaryotic translation initiation factor 3 subunit J [Geopyxis carbonaria]|nr:eukaryotic translation initiation factor 3 subunit J [Geopyxis carbonaria]